MQKQIVGFTSGAGSHAHLLVAETGGIVTMESPEAVMKEVEYRATHISALMEEMFKEAGKRDTVWGHDLG